MKFHNRTDVNLHILNKKHGACQCGIQSRQNRAINFAANVCKILQKSKALYLSQTEHAMQLSVLSILFLFFFVQYDKRVLLKIIIETNRNQVCKYTRSLHNANSIVRYSTSAKSGKIGTKGIIGRTS